MGPSISTSSGKSNVLHVCQQFTGLNEPIDNGDGTVTFVSTFSRALLEQIRLTNGRVLSRDAGRVTFTSIFDATTGDFISQTLSAEKGPHPDLDSDFAVFCNVIIPALT